MTEYEISINGRTRKLSLKRDAEGQDVFHAELDSGKQVKIVVKKRLPDFFIASIDDSLLQIRSYGSTSEFVNFEINGRHVFAELESRQKLSKKSQGSEVASVGETVVANFPAKVVKITQEKNLKENDTLMIVEAMKMEAQIKAPKDCIVMEVYVKEGNMVEKGTKLAKLSFAED